MGPIRTLAYRRRLRQRLQELEDNWAKTTPLEPAQRSRQWPPRIRERRAHARQQYRRSLRLIPQS
jgi:hypothetical protein